MSRLFTPASIEDAPEASKAALEAINKQMGSVPNLFRIVANSPQTLEGYLSLNGALGRGLLSVQIRERIALAVAQVNGCNYCLAAHSYLGVNLAKLSQTEIEAARRGTASDAKTAAAVEFAVKIARNRGAVSDNDLRLVRDAGYSDAEIVEIIGNVALNTLTNYVNEVLKTDIDFPIVETLAA